MSLYTMAEEGDNLLESTRTKVNTKHALCKFLAGCFMSLALSWGGIDFAFCIELKALFNLSQTEIGILSGVHIISIYWFLPFSIIHNKYGFYAAFLFGTFLTCSGFLLIAIAAMMPKTFLGQPLLLYVYMFLFSLGRCGILFLCLLTAMTSTPAAHSAKAVSCTATMMFCGELVVSPFYHSHFADVTKTASFFFTCLGVFVVGVVVYLTVYALTGGPQTFVEPQAVELGSCFYQEHNRPATRNNSFRLSAAKEGDFTHIGERDEKKGHELLEIQNISVREMFQSGIFHLYLWSGAVILAANLLAFTDNCLLLQSLGLRLYQDSLLVTMILTLAMSNIASGVVYDFLRAVSSKVYLLISVAVCNILSLGILLIAESNIILIFISGILTSVTTGAGLTVYLNFSGNIFGLRHIAMVQGILTTCFAIFGLIFSLVTGVIYDQFTSDNTSSGETNVCYGTQCFRWAWLLLLICSLMASVLPLLLLRRFKQIDNELAQ